MEFTYELASVFVLGYQAVGFGSGGRVPQRKIP